MPPESSWANLWSVLVLVWVLVTPLGGTLTNEFIAPDSARADTIGTSRLPFVGVDSLETRLTVAGVLLILVVILVVLLTLKIERLDRDKGITD